MRAVRDIGIVTGILNNGCAGAAQQAFPDNAGIDHSEAHLLAIGQSAQYVRRHLPGQQTDRRRASRRCRAGAGAEAGAVATLATRGRLAQLGRSKLLRGVAHATRCCSFSAKESSA